MIYRILPQPDIYATCPVEGGVLDYYSGVFEAVYVCLSPFTRPVHAHLEQFITRGTRCVDGPVSWSEVMQLGKFDSIAAIDLALKTLIGAVKKEPVPMAYAQQLQTLLDRGDVLPPVEGELCGKLVKPVLSLFKELGHEWVWVGDELCTERKLHWIDDLIEVDSVPIEGHVNVFAPDKSVLWTVHWDSHFTFLCGSLADLQKAKVAEQVEGFFCNAGTQVNWSMQETS